MFDKERFHNQLALNLGYERIVNNKLYNIKIEYDKQDIPVVTVLWHDNQNYVIHVTDNGLLQDMEELPPKIKEIADAIHRAYLESTKKLVPFVR